MAGHSRVKVGNKLVQRGGIRRKQKQKKRERKVYWLGFWSAEKREVRAARGLFLKK